MKIFPLTKKTERPKDLTMWTSKSTLFWESKSKKQKLKHVSFTPYPRTLFLWEYDIDNNSKCSVCFLRTTHTSKMQTSGCGSCMLSGRKTQAVTCSWRALHSSCTWLVSLAGLTKSAIDQREVKVVPGLVLFETKSLFGQTGMPTLPRKKWLTVFSQVQGTEPSPRGKKEGSNGRRKGGREGGGR